MNLTDKYVYELYRTRSFSKAAGNLYISQPSLSASIKKLEQKLGVHLFDRSTSPIRMTDYGNKYIELLDRVNDLENDFHHFISSDNALDTGHLSVGGSNLFSSYILPTMFAKFKEKYPHIQLTMVESNTAELRHRLANGEIDLLLDNFQTANKNFQSVVYNEEELLLAVPDRLMDPISNKYNGYRVSEILMGHHKTGKRRLIDLNSLQSLPFIVLKKENDTRQRADLLFENMNFHPLIHFELDQQVTAYNIARSGLGITFVSDTLVKHMGTNADLTFFQLDPNIALRKNYFFHMKNRYVNKAMDAFMQMNL